MNTNLAPELLQLSVAERIQLAEDLWDSVAHAPEFVPVTEEQKAELERRLAQFAQQPMAGRPWEEVKKERLRPSLSIPS